jgi:ATP-dependent helicase/nuclease subunit B
MKGCATMLTLILGRAGTGKTERMMDEICRRIAKRGRVFYIVPEQYSHEAERQLLRRCGDGLSLYGEVLSFTRLTHRVLAQTGGLAQRAISGGGRILLMSCAVSDVAGRLKVYGGAARRPEYLQLLVETVSLLKRACISPLDLEAASRRARDPLRDKLHDLSLIAAAYDARFTEDMIDPEDLPAKLAEAVASCSLFNEADIFIDGFTDFTPAELHVVTELLRRGLSMTVCLTCDGLEETEEPFETARRTAALLLREAEKYGIETQILRHEENRREGPAELRFLEQNLFSYQPARYEGEAPALEIYRGATPQDECEYAAARVLSLVRDGARWRDIIVAAGDWASYGALLENIFDKYGIPYYTSRRTDLRSKPPVALIESALEIILGGWEYEAVFRYLKTGLTGLDRESIDLLENYVLKWNIRGTVWTRREDWALPPRGYDEKSERDAVVLERLNTLRRHVARPLTALADALKKAADFGGMLRALYGFLEEIGLPERIIEKGERFRTGGQLQIADEYDKLWGIISHAMQQFFDVAGHVTGTVAEFAHLWSLLVSQYDFGTIPVSLDRVMLGDFTRQRRRGVGHLILIGASDDCIPGTQTAGGLLSDDERLEIMDLGLPIGETAQQLLSRAMYAVYALVTMPERRIFVSYPQTGFSGEEKRPSFVVRRMQEMFDIKQCFDTVQDFRLAAPAPCFEMAASDDGARPSAAAETARAYFAMHKQAAQQLRALREGAVLTRGALSPQTVRALYGSVPVMSASRVDTYYSCRYRYFLQYGLKLRPRQPAAFDASVLGTFIHDVLEKVIPQIRDGEGFESVTTERVLEYTEGAIREYVENTLDGFRDKSGRFIYLFNRLCRDAKAIVLDMVRELKDSDFRPLDFELEFSDKGHVPPYTLGEGEEALKIMGYVDRVDGWVKGDTLYVRVVDYKTGRKAFRLSDVYQGLNMQMLIYLFALCAGGGGRYPYSRLVPAGVLYIPARDELIKVSRRVTAEEIEKERLKKVRRTGLLLEDTEVLDAMAKGDAAQYLPVKIKNGAFQGDSLVRLERLGQLSRHIDDVLKAMVRQIRKGNLAAEPMYKNEEENACRVCDFRSACHFSQQAVDRKRYVRSIPTVDVWALMEGEKKEWQA